MIDEWRAFRDGTYEVSSLGNIRRNKPGISTFVGRPVKPIASATGYAQVALASPSGWRRFYVHRVVTEAFIGPCPSGFVVNHKDGQRLNNSLANLEYVSSKENAAHYLRSAVRDRGPSMPKPPKKGLPTGTGHWSNRRPDLVARGERMGASKLTTGDVIEIKKRQFNGEKQNKLAAEFGVSIAQVSRIVRGLRWAHVEVSE